jgi:hypothetical protein
MTVVKTELTSNFVIFPVTSIITLIGVFRIDCLTVDSRKALDTNYQCFILSQHYLVEEKNDAEPI